MKAFQIFCCLLLVVIILTGCVAIPKVSDKETVSDSLSSQSAPIADISDAMDYDSQLQLITANADVWMGDTERIAEPFFYAVTDLDRNGRLEIIQSFRQGTGLYTCTQLWEVDINKSVLVPCQLSEYDDEEDSQPDIITDNPISVYFDEVNNCYYYIFSDIIRYSAGESRQNLLSVSLQNGIVTTTLLAQSYSVADSNSDMTTTYKDANGNTIDENAYNMIADIAYADFIAMKSTIGWTDYSVSAQLPKLTESEIKEILKSSWEKFSLT